MYDLDCGNVITSVCMCSNQLYPPNVRFLVKHAFMKDANFALEESRWLVGLCLHRQEDVYFRGEKSKQCGDLKEMFPYSVT